MTRWVMPVRRPMAGLLLAIAVLVPISVGRLAVAQGSGPATHDARDLKTVIESGVLRVALTNFNLPAFHRRVDGQWVGPEIELARQIATVLGIKVEFVDTAQSFNGVVDLIDAGKADIGISKLSQTHARLRRVRFSQPYVTLRHAFLFDRAAISARSGGRPPEDVLRPFDGRIGVIRGSSYVDFAKSNFPRAQVVEMKDWDTAVATLLDHGVDAIYRDEFEIRRILKGRPSLNVNFGAAIMLDQKDVLSVAICDSCVKLQEFINFHISKPQAMFAIRTLLASDLQN